MAHEPGDIVLIDYPSSDLEGVKRRPGIILLNAEDADVVIARITGRKPRDARDLGIIQWRAAGLVKPSTVRLAKLVTFRESLILRDFGHISEADRAALVVALKDLFTEALARPG